MQAAQGFYVWMWPAFFSNERKEKTKLVSQAVLAKVSNYCFVWRRAGTEKELEADDESHYDFLSFFQKRKKDKFSSYIF